MTKEEVLQQYFGYSGFREGQEELIDSILSGRDAMGIMPTGAGKSICYQVPSLMLPGLTIVISPLISLMQDQVNALRENGIPAAFLNSSMHTRDYRDALLAVLRGDVCILYAAPERLGTQDFFTIAQEVPIVQVTVDEAHCVSQWGQDFRPSYLKIPEFLEYLPHRPIVSAFTATATADVQADIVRILGLRDPLTITTGFDRKNLYFEVQRPSDKFAVLQKLLRERKGQSGIVYCLSRRNVEEVCEKLNTEGLPATRYHAGLTDEERRKNQEAFICDRIPVIVATNAFGMGIDKSNVSFVIHYNMPKNMESYYQEAGRAGRDGSPADCILLYSGTDVHTNRFLIEKSSDNEELSDAERAQIREKELERLRQMTFYCTRTDCLRHFMLGYFGEKSDNFCGNCSCCRTNYEQRDMTTEALKIVSCIYRLHQRNLHFGAKGLTDILRGSKAERYKKFRFADTLSTFGCLSELPERQCREMLSHLLAENWISQSDGEYPALRLNENSIRLIREKTPIFIKIVKDTPVQRKASAVPETDDVLFQKLRECRAKLAAREHVPAYIIFTDAALRDMCIKKPLNDMAFLAVSGVGPVKRDKYGNIFMSVIRKYMEQEMPV